jgi:hypothetical protein
MCLLCGTSKQCIVHRDLGEPALPATCRHFPRVAVQDPRGIFISLSHFCPTAASMLFRDEPVEIVASPPAFPEADYEGLIVTEHDLPPMLTPRMLMDREGFTAWERHMVARFSDVGRVPSTVIATLWRDAQLLCEWRPGSLSLPGAIGQLPREYVELQEETGLATSLRRHAEVVGAVPDDLKPEPTRPDSRTRWRPTCAPPGTASTPRSTGISRPKRSRRGPRIRGAGSERSCEASTPRSHSSASIIAAMP